MNTLSYSDICKNFTWDLDTGTLYKKLECYGVEYGKKECTSKTDRGYCRVTLHKQHYYIHRIMYTIYHPEEDISELQIDHINGDKSDNRKENLRSATPSQNAMNRKTSTANVSGYKGISVRSRNDGAKYYLMSIMKNGKTVTKGFPYTDDGLKDAIALRLELASVMHGEYKNEN